MCIEACIFPNPMKKWSYFFSKYLCMEWQRRVLHCLSKLDLIILTEKYTLVNSLNLLYCSLQNLIATDESSCSLEIPWGLNKSNWLTTKISVQTAHMWPRISSMQWPLKIQTSPYTYRLARNDLEWTTAQLDDKINFRYLQLEDEAFNINLSLQLLTEVECTSL